MLEILECVDRRKTISVIPAENMARGCGGYNSIVILKIIEYT